MTYRPRSGLNFNSYANRATRTFHELSRITLLRKYFPFTYLLHRMDDPDSIAHMLNEAYEIDYSKFVDALGADVVESTLGMRDERIGGKRKEMFWALICPITPCPTAY